jgi:hypothetical protein
LPKIVKFFSILHHGREPVGIYFPPPKEEGGKDSGHEILIGKGTEKSGGQLVRDNAGRVIFETSKKGVLSGNDIYRREPERRALKRDRRKGRGSLNDGASPGGCDQAW